MVLKLEYQHFKAQDIKSLIVTPLRTSDSIIGFIGFDAVSSNRMWSVDDQSILHLVSEIISHALERIKADEMLQKSERKYRSIINNMQDVYYRADIQGNLELISPSALKLFGYESMDAIIGMNISKEFYADPEQRDIFLDMLKKNGGSITNYEVKLKKKDGSVVTVITSSAFHYDDQGNIQGVEGIFSDITERKKIEDALISSENNFRTFFETVDDLIFIGNQLGEIIYTNNAVSRKLGYTREELTTKHVLDVHPSEKRSEAEKIFADMFAGKRDLSPLPLQAKDGK